MLSKDIDLLANKKYHVIASSSAENKTKGVAIVLKRSLKYDLLGTWKDNIGRAVLAKVEISGRKIALWSIYAPNTYDRQFYPILLDKMLVHDDFTLLVGGDFNATWNNSMDKTGTSESSDQRASSSAMRSWANSLGLLDLWRAMNPLVKAYTFLSHRHRTSSRIDYIFTSPQLIKNVSKVSIIPIALSDHRGVLSSFALCSVPKRATRWRFNNTLLENKDFRDQFMEKLKEFLDFNVGSVDDNRILWEAVKGFIRSNVTLFSSNLRKAQAAKLQELENRFACLDSALSASYSEDLATQHDLT